MNPFAIIECKRVEGCELGDGHRGLCGKRHFLTREEVDMMLEQWRAGKYPDKPFGEPEFAS